MFNCAGQRTAHPNQQHPEEADVQQSVKRMRQTPKNKEYWKTNQSYCAILRALHREMYKGEEIYKLQIDKRVQKHGVLAHIVLMDIRKIMKGIFC